MKKADKIVIIGAGGFGNEVLWTLLEHNKISNTYEILGFIDDNTKLHGKLIHQKKVLGGIEWFENKTAKDVQCVIAIGNGLIRKKIVALLEKRNVKFATLIHPSVIMSESVIVGKGTIIQAGTIITVDVQIGEHCRIDNLCSIAHDSKIDDFVDLSPGVHINGSNIIEKGVFLGSGTTTKEKIHVGKWCVIGAGTVLINDVPDFSLCVGVPGKIKKKLDI
ncbi:acetyltransferase [Nitrosarchaeum sp.]|uniref:acetyltransferase n=1 Tax=Nitrosarchaeum sp. TaxID=2026886 RepID=UPI00247D33D1|nr:acetyltransferase [Nitrosarchaeum sp.]MCV0411880.1 acetyltransferase [Nitrosarchaeum sp.]